MPKVSLEVRWLSLAYNLQKKDKKDQNEKKRCRDNMFSATLFYENHFFNLLMRAVSLASESAPLCYSK